MLVIVTAWTKHVAVVVTTKQCHGGIHDATNAYCSPVVWHGAAPQFLFIRRLQVAPDWASLAVALAAAYVTRFFASFALDFVDAAGGVVDVDDSEATLVVVLTQ